MYLSRNVSFGTALALALALTAPAFAADYTAGTVKISNPWTRVPPPSAKVAGGFMTLTNTGTAPDRLVKGSSPAAGRIEIHEMTLDGGMMKMRELDKGLEINPGQTIELKPGSFHIMFMDLKEAPKEGGTVKGTLEFEKAGKVEIEYKVEPLGAKGTGSHHHHGK
jgi:periplasmic copper chaperone A